MKTAVIYGRQSYGSEVESVSIENQLSSSEKYCIEHEIKILGIFADKNTSSELYPKTTDGEIQDKYDIALQTWKKEQKTANRKEFKEELGKAFDFIKRNHVDFIVCYDLTRIYRNVTRSNLSNFIANFLISNKCMIVTTSTNSITDFSDVNQELVSAITGTIEYNSLRSKKNSSMESVKRRINSFQSVSNAFGVIYKDKRITFDKRKSEMIRFIFQSFVEGLTYPKILNALNTDFSDCLPTFNRKGIKQKAKQFYMSNIQNISSNLIYTGYTKNLKGEISRAVNVEQGIISFSLFQQVQEIIQNKKKGYQKYNLKDEKQRHFLPFSSYLKCRECGRKMVVVFDNGIVYSCNNESKHVNRIRMNYNNRGQDFYTTIQSLFMIHCIESRKSVEKALHTTQKVDELKDSLEKMKVELKAKFSFIKTDEDVEFFKDELTSLRNGMKEVQKIILIEETKDKNNLELLNQKINDDFSKIMEGKLMDEDSYMRLLEQTIEEIVIHESSVEVKLKDGKKFSIPRITVDKRGKKILPYVNIFVSPKIEGEYNDSKISEKEVFTCIQFFCDSERDIITYSSKDAEILLETDDYSIELYR